jgi:hypothetical protein
MPGSGARYILRPGYRVNRRFQYEEAPGCVFFIMYRVVVVLVHVFDDARLHGVLGWRLRSHGFPASVIGSGSMYVYMCICVYICTYVCMYVYICFVIMYLVARS